MKETQEPKFDAVMFGGDTHLVSRRSGTFIPSDEPVFILLGRDCHAAEAIDYYHFLCSVPGHRNEVLRRLDDFNTFANNHPERMREPGSHKEPASNRLDVREAVKLLSELGYEVKAPSIH